MSEAAHVPGTVFQHLTTSQRHKKRRGEDRRQGLVHADIQEQPPRAHETIRA